MTTDSRHEYTPRWSPDGTLIAYVKQGGELWYMNADGSGQRKVATTVTVDAKNLAWDPVTPGRVVFSHAKHEIYRVFLNGSGQQRILGKTLYSGIHGFASWDLDPSGQKLVYCWEDVNWTPYMQVFVFDIGTKRETEILGNDGLRDFNPRFSLDGRKIIWDRDTDWEAYNFGMHVWTMTVDGSGLRDLTPTATSLHFSSPTFAPDGRRVLASAMTLNEWNGARKTWDLYLIEGNGGLHD